MSDQEVIETLARFCGADKYEGRIRVLPPKFLTSIDALRPALDKLREEEWDGLLFELQVEFVQQERWKKSSQFCLTLPPATLARAIAEVIKDSR